MVKFPDDHHNASIQAIYRVKCKDFPDGGKKTGLNSSQYLQSFVLARPMVSPVFAYARLNLGLD
jgi:hypothetical protein